MKNYVKKAIAAFLTAIIAFSFCTAAFAATKTSDYKSKNHSEFGTLSGNEQYIGFVTNRKNITFETKISKLSSTTIATKLYSYVDVHDYLTGKYLSSANGEPTPGVNVTSNSYYWEGHSDAENKRKISSFGTHEARRSGSAVVYTEIYGF